MSTFTPGPWDVKNDISVFSALGADSGDGYKAHSTDGWQIADCSEGLTFVDGGMVDLSYDIKKANARLIAAAPDLLEALEDLKRELILSDVDMAYIESHFRPWINKAESAVAKARDYLFSPTSDKARGEA